MFSSLNPKRERWCGEATIKDLEQHPIDFTIEFTLDSKSPCITFQKVRNLFIPKDLKMESIKCITQSTKIDYYSYHGLY